MAKQAREHQVNRSELIDAFLSRNGWAEAKRVTLADDASFRKYERVFLGDKQAVLMDAPPGKEDIRPFIKIAEHLQAKSLSAPHIMAADAANGLLLLEDLGDDLFARVLTKNPQAEQELYLAAADVLVHLYHQASQTNYTDVPAFDMEKMLLQVALLPEWFLPLASGKKTPEELKTEYLELWREVLSKLPALQRVLVLYDYHAENMLWLPEREKHKRTGLLDFQDAMIGSPAYDMVSYLEDARRDITSDVVNKTIDYYLKQTGLPRDEFIAAYKLMGAQRNCRIVGVFSRLAVRDGKKRYLAFMPRVWAHIENDLSHPILAPIKQWLDVNVKPEWRGTLQATRA